MPLTPIDIEQKTFRVALRGYAEEEVDQFLDEIVVSLREYERQLRDAAERVAVLEEQLEANRDTEDRIKKTLVIAQRTADEVVQEARRESQQLLTDARTQASEIELERIKERETLVSDLERLRVSVAELKDRLTGLADRTLVDLDEISEEIDTAVPQPAGELEHADGPGGDLPSEEQPPWSQEADEFQERAVEEEDTGQAFLGSGRRPWERDSD